MGVSSHCNPVYGGKFVNIFQVFHRDECELHHVAPSDDARRVNPNAQLKTRKLIQFPISGTK